MAKRDVLWISLESVRADHTSVGGYKRDTTPNLDRLFSEEFHTANCYSHGIYTRTSIASILTGRPASTHGLGLPYERLPSSVPTIAEQFSKCGYSTACISPNPHISSATGLDRGFEYFDYIVGDTILNEVPYRDLIFYLMNLREHSAGYVRDTSKHSISYLTNKIAKKRIREIKSRDKPLFYYLHFGDTHYEYHPPKPWQGTFIDSIDMTIEEALQTSEYMKGSILEIIANDCDLEPIEMSALTTMYDSLISYVDYMISDLVESVSSELNDPIIVIASDHGENFGELDLIGHRLAFTNSLAEVPLYISGLDNPPSDAEIIQPLDAMEMVKNDLGVEIDIKGGIDIRNCTRDFAVTQVSGDRTRSNLKKIHEFNPDYRNPYIFNEDLTVVHDSNKCYYRTQTVNKLYSTLDSGDLQRVTGTGEEEEYESYFTKWSDRYGVPPENTREGIANDSRLEKQLRDMGYLA